MMIVVSSVAGWARSSRQTSTPERPGRTQSRKTTSGRSATNFSIADSPSGASTISTEPSSSVSLSREANRLLVLDQHHLGPSVAHLVHAARETRRFSAAGRSDLSTSRRSRARKAATHCGSSWLPARREISASASSSRQASVGPWTHQGIHRVHEREDPRPLLDLLACQPVRITAAVPAFVVVQDDLARTREEGKGLEDRGADLSMGSRGLGLVLVRVSGAAQHGVGHGDLADVVENEAVREAVFVHLLGDDVACQKQGRGRARAGCGCRSRRRARQPWRVHVPSPRRPLRSPSLLRLSSRS